MAVSFQGTLPSTEEGLWPAGSRVVIPGRASAPRMQAGMALWGEQPAKALAARETAREGARGDEKDGGRRPDAEIPWVWPVSEEAGRHRTGGCWEPRLGG